MWWGVGVYECGVCGVCECGGVRCGWWGWGGVGVGVGVGVGGVWCGVCMCGCVGVCVWVCGCVGVGCVWVCVCVGVCVWVWWRFLKGKKSLKGSALLLSWQHCASVGPRVKLKKIRAALIEKNKCISVSTKI